MKNYTPIRVGNKVIGQVRGDAFIKRVQASRHFLTTPPAIALDVGSLAQAERTGARRVHVIDTKTGTIYRASIEHIRRAGFEINRGFGRQIALTLDGWTKSGPGELLADQLSLWG